IAEDTTLAAGSKSVCSRCQQPVTLFAAAFYVEKILDRYQALLRELDALKIQEEEKEEGRKEIDPAVALTAGAVPLFPKEQMHSTLLLATAQQHQPIQDWLAARQVKAVLDYSLVDTTGFFDEAAGALGDHYAAMAPVLEQVRYGYRQDWTWVNVDLGNRPHQEKQLLKSTLRQLYGHTFFARYAFHKEKNSVGVALQPAQRIRRFFDGEWLEWWAFMALLEMCLERNVSFSCGRGVRVEFQDEEQRELDVLFLLKNELPVVVECKSGEFRADLEKYTRLQKRLGLSPRQFILCNPDLDDAQAQGMSAMYGLTFVNLKRFVTHIHSLV
ncbi:MAG TPA: DUF1887 family CARF protein, partial [Candidatus Acidoferrum sp.]|nr:DUF1887 family CARF protein [Candidatus Acidoferrum sp.]